MKPSEWLGAHGLSQREVLSFLNAPRWLMDGVAAGIMAIFFFLLLGLNEVLTKKCKLNSKLTRKMLHIGTGLIAMGCWPLFSRAKTACLWAALPPFGQTLLFLGLGTGIIKLDAAVRNVSRSGAREEMLKGPMAYSLIITITTLLLFRGLPGVLALSCLCVGDGFSDIIGRRYGRTNPLPWSKQKSWAGTCAFAVSAFIAAVGFGALYMWLGWAQSIYPHFLVVCIFAALVESLPIKEWDNLTIVCSAIVMDYAIAFAMEEANGQRYTLRGTSNGVLGLLK